MSDESSIPTPPEPQPAEEPPAETPVGSGPPDAEPAEAEAAAGPTASEAWDDVVANLRELGDAITAWAKAAADTPESRRHIDEVRNGVNDMARQANEAFASMSSSDFGRQVADGANRAGSTIGETAQEFGQAAAPHVATAFAGLADAFGRAAQKVGESAASPTAPDPSPRPAPEPPAAAATPMPATPEPAPAAEAEVVSAPEDDAAE